MNDSLIRVRSYVLVCVLLVILTVLTVGLSFWHVQPVWHVVMGLVIATCKASLVVLFFMQALVSPRLIWLVIAISCFWLCIMLVLTLADYFSRGMIPIAPGH
jgi:cytochrome c oxidase subunit IV